MIQDQKTPPTNLEKQIFLDIKIMKVLSAHTARAEQDHKAIWWCLNYSIIIIMGQVCCRHLWSCPSNYSIIIIMGQVCCRHLWSCPSNYSIIIIMGQVCCRHLWSCPSNYSIIIIMGQVCCRHLWSCPSNYSIIIIMGQVCCRHLWSCPSNRLCRQFSWWAHCWGILFLLRNYSDCLCILSVVFLCFWYHKSFHSVFAFLAHQLYLYVQ